MQAIAQYRGGSCRKGRLMQQEPPVQAKTKVKNKPKVNPLFALIVSMFFIYLGVDALLSQEVTGRTNTYSMEDSPITFTILVSVYWLCGVFAGYSAVRSRFKKDEN